MRFREFAVKEAWYNPFEKTNKFSVTLPSGTRGNEVADMQQALEALGYTVGPTGIDGIIGKYTSSAIKKYQEDSGLSATGSPTAELIAELNKELSDNPQILSKMKPVSDNPNFVVAAKTTQLKPLSQDSVTTGKVGQILNFVAKYESNGNYNIVIGGGTQPLTKMTIAEVYQLQDQLLKSGKESSAVGRYQFVKRTLKECVTGLNLDPDKTLFDEKTQDALIIYRLRSVRGLDNWLSGSLSTEKFLNNLSQEFASIPSPQKGGVSYYQGVGSNTSGTNLQSALSTLTSIQTA